MASFTKRSKPYRKGNHSSFQRNGIISDEALKQKQEESLHKYGLCPKYFVDMIMQSNNITEEMRQSFFNSVRPEYSQLKCYGRTCYKSHNINGESKNFSKLKNAKISTVPFGRIFIELCEKIQKYKHLFINFCSNKKLTEEEKEYLTEASNRFGNINLRQNMLLVPDKNNPEMFFKLLINWRLVYGKLLKTSKKSAKIRGYINGIKFKDEIDWILWAMFEILNPCYKHCKFVDDLRSEKRIILKDLCKRPDALCKCGVHFNLKNTRWGSFILCKHDFINGECNCINEFLDDEPIQQHADLHATLTSIKTKLDNLKNGEIEIDKKDEKILAEKEIDVDDIDEVSSFLIKYYQDEWDKASNKVYNSPHILGIHYTKMYNMVPLSKQTAKLQKEKVKKEEYCEELEMISNLSISKKEKTVVEAKEDSTSDKKEISSTAAKEDISESDSDSDSDFFD